MSESTIHERVYDQIFRDLPAYKLPEPWHGFPPGGDLRGAPADPAAVFGRLQERFPIEDLLKTNVAVFLAACHQEGVGDGAR